MSVLTPAAFRVCCLLAVCLLAFAGCTTAPHGPLLADGSAGAAPGLGGGRSASLTRMADTAFRSGETTTAASLYEEALLLDGGNVPAALGLGHALLAQGRAQEASRAFERAIKASDGSAEAHLGYARAMIALRRPEVAAEHLRGILEREPDHAQALNALGVAYDLQGQHRLAIETYRKGLAGNPTSIPLRNNLGLSLALAGQVDEAIDRLRPLGEGPEATRRTRQNLALAYGLRGDLAAAERLGRIDLGEAELRDNLAYIAAVRGMQDPVRRATTLAPISTPSLPPRQQPATWRSAPERPAPPRPLGPAAAEPAPAASSGGFVLDLGRFADAATARKRWEHLQQRHPQALHGLAKLAAAGSGADPLLVGPIASEAEAVRLCAKLETDVPACSVVRL